MPSYQQPASNFPHQQQMGAMAASQPSAGGTVPGQTGTQANLLQQRLLSVLSQKTGGGPGGAQDISKTIQQLLQTQAALKAQQGQAQPSGMAKPVAQPGTPQQQQQSGYQGVSFPGQPGYRAPAPATGSNVGGTGRMY